MKYFTILDNSKFIFNSHKKNMYNFLIKILIFYNKQKIFTQISNFFYKLKFLLNLWINK
jgi:hypothetical protein